MLAWNPNSDCGARGYQKVHDWSGLPCLKVVKNTIGIHALTLLNVLQTAIEPYIRWWYDDAHRDQCTCLLSSQRMFILSAA